MPSPRRPGSPVSSPSLVPANLTGPGEYTGEVTFTGAANPHRLLAGHW
jgi:hypothetical protein